MHIHLISFNVPYPADYGGVIDVFYKIKALSSLGVKVILHCYSYGRSEADELNSYCERVNYYERPLGFINNISSLPYIVKTRSSNELLKSLLSDNYPILFEGLHCTHPLFIGLPKDRTTIVRTHNIEHEYYEGLARTEKNLVKKIFFKMEASKLKRYEKVLAKASAIAAISANDQKHFNSINPNTILVTPFHPFSNVDIVSGMGDYVIMHGDLSVPENIESVLWILSNVAPRIQQKLIVAGKNPHQSLYKACNGFSNVQIIANPNDAEMANLVRNAHVNLIHSFHPQGFKLKLLYSLYNGRFCLCCPSVVEGTGLSEICHLAQSADEFVSAINGLFEQSFENEQLEKRRTTLSGFSNELQAEKILSLIEKG